MELERIVSSQSRPMVKLMSINRLVKSYRPLLIDEHLPPKDIKLFFELHRRTVGNLK
jgi:hypothetical protein